jgi:ferritin-like metal-binding protein YciE
MAYQNLKELFIFKLNQTISFEKSMQKLTSELSSGAQYPQVKDALQRHESSLGTQISHLEECVGRVGGQVTQVENYGIEGMLKEVGEFRRQNPSVEAFDLYRLGTLIKLGFWKVADYHMLARYARALGDQTCSSTIESDLREIEDHAKKFVDTLGQVAQQWGGSHGGPSMGMR